MKFDNDKLKDRMDNVVVCSTDDGIILLLVRPGCNLFAPGWRGIDLASGMEHSHTLCTLAEYSDVEWVISPGDRCEVLDAFYQWEEITYNGFSGKPNFPFKSSRGYSFGEIRPLPKDPKKSKLLKTIEQTKESLLLLEKELEEYKEEK